MKRFLFLFVLNIFFTFPAWSDDELTIYQGISNGQLYYSVINENTNYGYMDLYFSIIDEDAKTCELKTVEFFWEEKYNHTITIPEVVSGYIVKGIGKKAFSSLNYFNYNYALTVVLPNSIEYFANEAFAGFGRRLNVELPNGLKVIGNNAFYNSGIQSVDMPNSVELIGSYSFSYCNNLSSVILSDNLTNIPDWAFGECSNLKTVHLPNNLVSIGEYAFSGCDLDEITLPQSLVSIGFWAFTSNNITSLIIPQNVRELSSNSFVCSKISSIVVDEQNPYYDSRGNCNAIINSKSNALVKGCINTVIPNTVTCIGEDAFANCYDMTELPVIPESVIEVRRNAFMGTQWDMNLPNGLIYVGNVVYYYNGDKESLTSLVLRDGTKGITEGTFEMCTNLTSVILPDGLIHIGNWAFSECTNLTDITFSNTIQHIGDNAFYGTPWKDNLGEGLTYIGKVAYKYKVGNQENINIMIEEGTVSISSDAFSGISVPMTVTLPSSLREIGGCAFGSCPNIQTIYSYIENPFEINPNTFIYNIGAGSYQFTSADLFVPKGTKTIYEETLGWNRFQNIVEMPAPAIVFADPEVKRICVANWDSNGDGELDKDEAAAVNNLYTKFSGNKTITSFDELKFFTGLTSIDQSAFSSCTNLTSIIIPENVVSIGWMAFAYCYNLQSVIFPTGLQTIGIESFKNCRSLLSVALHENVKTVGWSAFEGCTSLQKVIADELESWCKIGFGNNGNPLINAHHLFIEDEEVTNLVVPNTIQNILYGAFEGCTGLETVFVHKDVKNIAYGAFNNCTNLERVDIEDLEAWCKIEFGSGDDTYSPLYYAHHLYLNGEEIHNLVIPDGITSIGYESFQGCWSLTTVEIPSSVRYIGEFAFSGSINVASIVTHVVTPIRLEGDEFSNRPNITLYVPAGCKEAYESAEYWTDFKDIIEMEEESSEFAVTDISQLDNAVYIEPFTARAGEEVQLVINLKNAEEVSAYIFDMELPEGVTVATNSNGKYIDALSDRHDDHSRTINYKGNNVYSLSALSTNSEVLTGNDGPIRFLTLLVADDMEEGVYAINIRNASYSRPNGSLVEMENTTSTITVEDYLLGDVNGNNGIDIGDAVSIVNFLVGKPNQNFIEKAADTNKNGKTDIGDAVTIVNYLVGKTESLAPQLILEEETTNQRDPD